MSRPGAQDLPRSYNLAISNDFDTLFPVTYQPESIEVLRDSPSHGYVSVITKCMSQVMIITRSVSSLPISQSALFSDPNSAHHDAEAPPDSEPTEKPRSDNDDSTESLDIDHRCAMCIVMQPHQALTMLPIAHPWILNPEL
jgi:hypothetical protein